MKLKEGKTTNLPAAVFPPLLDISCMVQQISHRYSIMKNNNFFKHNPKFQDNLSSRYEREATVYQSGYNRKHPGKHIWRHMLYKRTFYFYLDGMHISVEVEIVRFRHARTNNTFTFHGTLFCAYSHFSAGFIKQAVSSSGDPLSPSALAVSVKTLNCWVEWVRNGRIFSDKPQESIRP